MKYIAAYALLVLGGNASPNAADVEKVLKEAGIKSEAEHVEKLITALNGRPFHELVAAGTAKIASMGTVAAAPAGGAPAAAAKQEAVKEAPKEEEAADVDMGGLFGDDYWALSSSTLCTQCEELSAATELRDLALIRITSLKPLFLFCIIENTTRPSSIVFLYYLN